MAIGNPISLTNNIAEKTSSQIAAANQAQFIVSGGYLVNKLGVYRNGVKLSQSSDYTANDGDTVNLVVPANDGDVIQFQVFDYFNIADAITTEGGTVAGTLTVEGSIVANGGVTGDLTGDVTGDISGATATFTGDVSIGGTLTYEDVTNIDSVGIITARSGIHVTGGNVGIGTDNPTTKLHITGNASNAAALSDTVTDYALKFDSAITSNYFSNAICFAEGNNVNASIASFDGGSGGAQGLVFGTGPSNTERLRIDSAGNVGIGTNDPQQLLEISSGAPRLRITDNNTTAATSNSYLEFQGSDARSAVVYTDSNGLNLQTDAPAANPIRFLTGGTGNERMRIDSGGDVGIGTTNPAQLLELSSTDPRIRITDNDTTAASGSASYLEFYGSDARSGIIFTNAVGLNVRADSTGPGNLVFTTGTNERMRIDSSGNVGIATDNPTEKLHVIGNILASGNITAFSDIKLKDNIEVIPNALDKVVQIRGVTFDRIDEEVPRQSGVIAQEVEKVLPEVVITNKDGIKSVAYGNLVGLLIESIKELKVEVNELKARLEE